MNWKLFDVWSWLIGAGYGALGLSIVLSATASAQQQHAPSASEQALSGELMEQINKNVQLRTNLITLAKQLEEAKAKIAELEKKPDDKKAEKPVAELPKK